MQYLRYRLKYYNSAQTKYCHEQIDLALIRCWVSYRMAHQVYLKIQGDMNHFAWNKQQRIIIVIQIVSRKCVALI